MTAATLFGRPLRSGGTIGVAAPASPYDSRSEILRGVEWWEEQGYRVKLYNRVAYVAAGSPGLVLIDVHTPAAPIPIGSLLPNVGQYGSLGEARAAKLGTLKGKWVGMTRENLAAALGAN